VFEKETKYQKLSQGARCNDLAFDVFEIQEKLPTLAGDMRNQFS
jgi:hypothetical protein